MVERNQIFMTSLICVCRKSFSEKTLFPPRKFVHKLCNRHQTPMISIRYIYTEDPNSHFLSLPPANILASLP